MKTLKLALVTALMTMLAATAWADTPAPSRSDHAMVAGTHAQARPAAKKAHPRHRAHRRHGKKGRHHPASTTHGRHHRR